MLQHFYDKNIMSERKKTVTEKPYVTAFMLQLFYDKKICLRVKKTVTDKPWQTCYMAKPFHHSKIWDTKRFERNNKKLLFFRKFVTEKLIFRSSR